MIRDGRWADRHAGTSLLGATVLIVGLGAIGTAVARRLAPFGARLLAVRAHPELGGPAEVTDIAGPGRLPGLLGIADAVVCCAMFSDETAGLFDAGAFAAMKPGSLFVNVARGGLVDEAALLAALESGQVGGAGLDVYAHEPPDGDSPLLRHPRVVATPHVGGLTEVMFRRTAGLFAANLHRWAAGEPPRWAVNEPSPGGRLVRARDRSGILEDVADDLRVNGWLVIPASELRERFSRSSGPGGQSVNTADSRVELSFDVAHSSVLPEHARARVLERLGSRMSDGVLTVVASEQRSQLLNRRAARGRLAALLREAIAPPPRSRVPTRPGRGAKERRIAEKKQRGAIKRGRRLDIRDTD